MCLSFLATDVLICRCSAVSSDVGIDTQKYKCSWHAIRSIPKRWLVQSLGHTFWPLSALQEGEILKLLGTNSVSSCNDMGHLSPEESRSRESNSLSASQDITHLYVTRRFPLRGHISPARILILCFFIHFFLSRKPRLTAVGIYWADHATPSIRKSWH
jgi:hypothetical protein